MSLKKITSSTNDKSRLVIIHALGRTSHEMDTETLLSCQESSQMLKTALQDDMNVVLLRAMVQGKNNQPRWQWSGSLLPRSVNNDFAWSCNS